MKSSLIVRFIKKKIVSIFKQAQTLLLMKERKNKTFKRLPNGAVVKNSPANAGDVRDTIASLGQEDPLDKEMANYSSILAWEIPWTEDPDRLQFMGLQTVRHGKQICSSVKQNR